MGVKQVGVKRQPFGRCERVFNKSRCYFNPEEILAWSFPSGRGNYCGTCYPTHRNCLEAEVKSLPYFPTWLDKPGNLQKWRTLQLAYIALKKLEGGESRLSKDRQRIQTKSHLFITIANALGKCGWWLVAVWLHAVEQALEDVGDVF